MYYRGVNSRPNTVFGGLYEPLLQSMIILLFLPAIVTSACLGFPTDTPMSLASSTTSKLSSSSTIVSFTIGMDTVTSVSPGKIVILIGVLSKSAANGMIGNILTSLIFILLPAVASTGVCSFGRTVTLIA